MSEEGSPGWGQDDRDEPVVSLVRHVRIELAALAEEGRQREARLQGQLDELHAAIAGLPRHDLAPLRLSLGTVANHVATMRHALEALPTDGTVDQVRAATEAMAADVALATEVLGALAEVVEAGDAGVRAHLEGLRETVTEVAGQVADLGQRTGEIGTQIEDGLVRSRSAIDGRLHELRREVTSVATIVASLQRRADAGPDLGAVDRGVDELLRRSTDGAARDAELQRALADLDERWAALPPPDLGPVAAQLARLTAAVQELRRPVAPPEPDAAGPLVAPALDLVTQVERDLHAVNGRLATLADRVERAAIAAEDAADVAAAAMRVAAQERDRAARATTPARKAATTKKATAKKATATKKAATTKKAAKKATPAKKAAAPKRSSGR